MQKKDFNLTLRAETLISLFIAALEKSFPLLLRSVDEKVVDGAGQGQREKVFQTLKAFSTSFPQRPVDVEGQ